MIKNRFISKSLFWKRIANVASYLASRVTWFWKIRWLDKLGRKVMQVPEFGSSSSYNRTVMSTLTKSPRDSSVQLGGHRFMTKPVGWQMACSPSGRGVNSVTSTWLALYRARVFYYVWVSKAGARKRVRRPPPRLSERATFFYAMSIAKRIWPAILIDSKFSTKLHGIGLSPRYFEIEKKDSFWSTANSI